METVPKFSVWQAVTMRYTDWDGERSQVNCFIHSSTCFECPEWGNPGFHYMLRIPSAYDLDKTDRQSLEGENRDLYGWFPESGLRPRMASKDATG